MASVWLDALAHTGLPDIAGRCIANPTGTLSTALMLARLRLAARPRVYREGKALRPICADGDDEADGGLCSLPIATNSISCTTARISRAWDRHKRASTSSGGRIEPWPRAARPTSRRRSPTTSPASPSEPS